jgi:hypothetical protein
MCGVRVDVAREHVGLAAIALDVGRCARVVDRIEHVEQLDGLVAAARAGAIAITTQIAACVYCPPFSRTPGG